MQLQSEQKELWEKRRIVVAAVTAAAAEGDRSENAEYIYRKKELRGLDRRIRYLKGRLPHLKVVREKPRDQNRVYFGARVSLEQASRTHMTCRIVGSDEISACEENISLDSPVARSLLGREAGDEVEVETPGGRIHWRITHIEYL